MSVRDEGYVDWDDLADDDAVAEWEAERFREPDEWWDEPQAPEHANDPAWEPEGWREAAFGVWP